LSAAQLEALHSHGDAEGRPLPNQLHVHHVISVGFEDPNITLHFSAYADGETPPTFALAEVSEDRTVNEHVANDEMRGRELWPHGHWPHGHIPGHIHIPHAHFPHVHVHAHIPHLHAPIRAIANSAISKVQSPHPSSCMP
jgi:hypothetical protein